MQRPRRFRGSDGGGGGSSASVLDPTICCGCAAAPRRARELPGGVLACGGLLQQQLRVVPLRSVALVLRLDRKAVERVETVGTGGGARGVEERRRGGYGVDAAQVGAHRRAQAEGELVANAALGVHAWHVHGVVAERQEPIGGERQLPRDVQAHASHLDVELAEQGLLLGEQVVARGQVAQRLHKVVRHPRHELAVGRVPPRQLDAAGRLHDLALQVHVLVHGVPRVLGRAHAKECDVLQAAE